MANENNNLQELFNAVNSVLEQADLSNVTAAGTGSQDLPAGYYLCEVQAAELVTGKSSGKPQVHLTFKTVANGITMSVDDRGEATRVSVQKTENKFIHMYYPLSAENNAESVKRFVSDMMKFEGKPGEQLLPKEAYQRADVLKDSLDLIASMHCRIYVNISITKKEQDDGTSKESVWKNVISWKKANDLALPQ